MVRTTVDIEWLLILKAKLKLKTLTDGSTKQIREMVLEQGGKIDQIDNPVISNSQKQRF